MWGYGLHFDRLPSAGLPGSRASQYRQTRTSWVIQEIQRPAFLQSAGRFKKNSKIQIVMPFLGSDNGFFSVDYAHNTDFSEVMDVEVILLWD